MKKFRLKWKEVFEQEVWAVDEDQAWQFAEGDEKTRAYSTIESTEVIEEQADEADGMSEAKERRSA